MIFTKLVNKTNKMRLKTFYLKKDKSIYIFNDRHLLKEIQRKDYKKNK